MKLRKTTIEDLENKCPDIVKLLKGSLAKINDMQELLNYINEYTRIDLMDEITEYFEEIYIFNPNDEYLEHFLGKYINRNVNRVKSNYSEDMSEEEQIKIFKKVKEIEDDTLDEVMDLLSSFNRDTVLNKLKEYNYINK